MNTTNQAGHKDGLKSPLVNLIGFKKEFPVIELLVRPRTLIVKYYVLEFFEFLIRDR